jgi:hypothetical protein
MVLFSSVLLDVKRLPKVGDPQEKSQSQPPTMVASSKMQKFLS